MTQLKSSASSQIDRLEPSNLNSRISPWLTRLLYPLGCYIVIPLFFGKIEVTGIENIPKQDPVIVAPNHRSRWDALIVPYAVGRIVSGRDLRFMVSANEVKGLQGWFIRRMGGFPVNTERPQIGCVRHSIELLQEDREMVVIFPEGGIYRERKIQPLKRGVARIALEVAGDRNASNVKILPVGIVYSKPCPSWGTNVRVNIGSPLNVSDYLGESLRKSSQKLTNELQTQLQNLCEEIII
jgi:1-acyl-sn-glycerol-3-phosphate acyltransferase